MQEVTITQISPAELEKLIENSVKKIFSNIVPAQKIEVDCWFNLLELIAYLPHKPAKATIYAYVAADRIPYHKGRKKLRFSKSEIDTWLKSGRKITPSEIEIETDT